MPEACEVLDFKDYMTLPLGAVIYGRVTIGQDEKEVICRADEIDPPKTAKYFLCKMQKFLNGGNDTIGEKGVEVEKIEFPDRAQTLKLVGGNGWGALDNISEDSSDQTPKLIGRMIDYCRSRVENFLGYR